MKSRFRIQDEVGGVEKELGVGLLVGYKERNWMNLRRNRRVDIFCFVVLCVVLNTKGIVWV